jgi:ABC-type glycerol-3-phosphate transport system substrate-binding protein
MFALLTVLALLAAACGGSTASPSASADAGKAEFKKLQDSVEGKPADPALDTPPAPAP